MKNRRFPLSPKLASVPAGLIVALLVISQVFADFVPAEWPFVKAVVLPSGLQGEGLIEVLPDADVFAGSSPSLADLRVIAGDSAEVPFKIEVDAGERRRDSFAVSVRDTGYVPGRYTTFVADLGREGILHNEIEIRTTSSNFRETASVETSTDGATWAVVGEDQVFDFTVEERGFTTRDTGVTYPQSSARYLRVRIGDDGEEALEITGATVFFTDETPPREVEWPAAILGSSREVDHNTTVIELDMGAQGLPTHRLAVGVPDVNFYREVDLETSSDREDWESLARATVYSFETPAFTGESLAFTFRETTSRYFRLVVHDEDNLPLDVQAVEMWGLQRRLVFSADPTRSYGLYYGNDEARQPSYDIERVLPYLDTEDLPRATLGPHGDNPTFRAPEPRPLPVSERLSWLLPAVISVAAVFVGVMLFGVLRRARKLLPPPPE
jgi:hypothetical protein